MGDQGLLPLSQLPTPNCLKTKVRNLTDATPTFVLVAAGLQIMADLISYWALEIIGWLNLTGLIAGALAMAAALSIKKKIQAIPAR